MAITLCRTARSRTALTLALFLLVVGAVRAADVNVDDLRPGLVTTHQDGSKRQVVRLEPTVALNLKAGEATHPRLAADGGGIVWKGYINILRAGNYRFQANLRGKLRLTVGGKEVFLATVDDKEAVLKQGAEVKLDAGWQPFVAEFVRLPGAARVELRWQAPHFTLEPLPYHQVAHLPTELPARFTNDNLIEQGRRLAEETACVRCHRPDDGDKMAAGLTVRQGPNLSKVGQRVHAGWLDAWLAAPHQLRTGTPMPQMFTDDEAGRTERYAVARYLASLGGPLKDNPKPPNPKDVAASVLRGDKLFNTIGCAVCHLSADHKEKKPKDDEDRPATSEVYAAARVFPLTGLGTKTTPERLAEYLQDPLKIDPSGRMPHMLLQQNEAIDLARYLCKSTVNDVGRDLPAAPGKASMIAAFKRVDDRADELKAFEKLKEDAQWHNLGERLVLAKGCNNCHTIEPNGKPFANMLAKSDLNDLKKMDNPTAGCLAGSADKRGRAPWFRFTATDRDALRAFLKEGLNGAGSPAPTYAARATIERHNCLACHTRDGAGGLSPTVTEELRRYEKAENGEAVSPPTLTGIGSKVRTPWLRQLLTQGGRARPWMSLRMPQFGEANVGHLATALPAMEGLDPDDTVHKVSVDTAKIAAGRLLVSKKAFGCISCHDIAGNITGGTRGPDLATTNQRVRYDWFRRWLEQSQRMAPGTRMPSVFINGKSPLTTVFDGNADAQAEAIWAYLSLGPTLPLPDDLEIAHGKGRPLVVGDRPVILRTFMPDAGSRAIAIGFPGGVSTAFDAATCRMAYAWSGRFLDASPVWDDRGGNPAKTLGARFWSAPPGCPLSVGPSAEPPDFAARAKDPAYGGAMPEGKVYDGETLLRFRGYSTDKDGLPTFRYNLVIDREKEAAVTERAEPLKSAAGVGVGRRFALEVPAAQTTWLQVGTSTRTPRLLDAKGAPLSLDVKDAPVDVSASKVLVLPQDGDKVLLLVASSVPDGSEWRIQKLGGGWQVLLHVPAPTAATKLTVGVNVWMPFKDEPGLIKDVLTAK
jgi:mono/diheme cytochrome c family protein